jgi:hypothetical protein
VTGQEFEVPPACKNCGLDLRRVDGEWIDAESHRTCREVAGISLPHEPDEPVALHSEFDGRKWAKEFCRITGFKDEEWAWTWFANAIMTGHDFALRKMNHPDDWIPTEALFAFMGWLTSRDEESPTFSSHHDASPAVELIRQFSERHHLAQPRDGWHKLIEPEAADSPGVDDRMTKAAAAGTSQKNPAPTAIPAPPIPTVHRSVHYFDREEMVNADTQKRKPEPFAAIITRVLKDENGNPTTNVSLAVFDPELGQQIVRDAAQGDNYDAPEAGRWYFTPYQGGPARPVAPVETEEGKGKGNNDADHDGA